jgi:tetratricopeptide (TPR) repeat protein
MLSIFVATNPPPVVISNEVHATTTTTTTTTTTSIVAPVTETNDPVEVAYQKLLAEDDTAQSEVDRWIRDNQAFAVNGGGAPNAELNRRIEERLKPIKQAYENFIAAHPDHARARVAYGSYLNDTGDEDGAKTQWEKGVELDPTNPAGWNNLANYFGEHGPVTNAFAYYAKAIELNPSQPIYYHNFGTTIYLFRKDAMEYFDIPEQQVFDKALTLYNKAIRLDPDNFPLATDVAQTYYGIKPLRTNDALQAWTNTLAIAHDEVEREGVYLHLARVKLAIGRFAEAHAHLDAVTNEMYAELKKRLARNLAIQENPPTNSVATNAPAAAIEDIKAPPFEVEGKSWKTNALPKAIYRLGR